MKRERAHILMALCVRLDLAVPETLYANASFVMFLHMQLHVTLFFGDTFSILCLP